MSFWKRLFGSKDKPTSTGSSPQGGGTAGKPPSRPEEKEPTKSQTAETFSSGNESASPIEFQRDRREVRVFISSTFRDMMQEREVLVKKVFPQLRKLCAGRFVTFTEVDLRWGITDEQKDEGKVLPLCLAEIERCRPFFIGILGERYGWVPDETAFTKKLLLDQPWLIEHKDGASVTELEIIHGVLADHAMRDKAFFYFRASERSQEVEEELKKEPDYRAEPESLAAKLNVLKKKIKDSGYPVSENYSTAETLGKIVLEDLTKAIDTLYPETATPSETDREAAAQESYAIGKRLAYVERPSHTSVLDQYIDEAPQGKGIVITGESGCGKTALLAVWTQRRRAEHPEEFLIQHYLGATPESASALGCVRRLLGELKERYDLTEEIPLDTDKLRAALPLWLAQTVDKDKIIIVLDGLNQIEGEERDKRLDWLPRFVPCHVRIITSALPGPALEELRKRQWHEHKVPLADVPERKEIISTFLRLYRKELREDLFRQLAETPASANPLYLRTALEELRIFGSHEELPVFTKSLIQTENPAELFRVVIQRWMKDYSPDKMLAAKALKLLWAARQGLSEHEWIELMEWENSALLRIEWTPLLLAMEPHLNQRAGLYTFGHAYFREAVEAELVSTEEDLKKAHLAIADYFEAQRASPRKAAELPWQLREAGDREHLPKCLLDIPLFLLMQKRDQSELLSYWVWLGQERTMGKSYISSFELWSRKEDRDGTLLSDVANELAYFMVNDAIYPEAEQLYRYAGEICEKAFGNEHPETIKVLSNLAVLFLRKGENDKAERLLSRVLEVRLKTIGLEHPDTVTTMSNLGVMQQKRGNWEDAERLLREALMVRERLLGIEHPKVATSANNLAGLLLERGNLAAAESLYKRAISIREKCQPNHPDLAVSLQNLAFIEASKGNHATAAPLYHRALDIIAEILGEMHPDAATILSNWVYSLHFCRNFEGNEELFHHAIEICSQVLGAKDAQTAICLVSMAALLANRGAYEKAEELYRQALSISEERLGAEHEQTSQVLDELGGLFFRKGDYSVAEPFFRQALDIRKKVLGVSNWTASSYYHLGALLMRKEKYAEAAEQFDLAAELCEKISGVESPNAELYRSNSRTAIKKVMSRS